MFNGNWPIRSAIDRRDYQEAQRAENRRYREMLDRLMTARIRPLCGPSQIEFAGNGTTRSESMNERYGETKTQGTMAGRGLADAAQGAQSAGRLEAQIKQIHSYINDIEIQQENVNSALSRLLDPRPMPTEKTVDRLERANPSMITHEGALRMIIDRLNQLHVNAVRQADILNSAV